LESESYCSARQFCHELHEKTYLLRPNRRNADFAEKPLMALIFLYGIISENQLASRQRSQRSKADWAEQLRKNELSRILRANSPHFVAFVAKIPS
jgi:hypothetical protein